MTDTPKDPSKSGSAQGLGSQAGKRPTATIDLQATELERRDLPPDPGDPSPKDDSASADPKDTVATETVAAESASTNDAPEPDKGKTASRPVSPAPKPPSRAGSFASHLLAGAAGAGLAIFGADYLVNTIGLSLPTYSAAQVDQLTRRISALEQDGKERSADASTNLLREQLDALKVKLDQTAGATASIGGLQAAQKQLEDRTGKLDQILTAQPAATEITGRLGKLEDQFKMLAQAGAAGQAGNSGTMAALIAKVDTIGSNLDAHLSEMRKSLQSELGKQSSHFEDRLAEIDKGMAVDTLRATEKSLSDQIVAMKANDEKLHQDISTAAAGTQQLRQDLAALQQTTADLKTQMTSDAATFAKTQQLSDVNATAAKLQSDMAAIASRDKIREQSASQILLMLDLSNLKRATESGNPYAKELAEVKRLAPKEIDLSALEPAAEKGLPTRSLLASEFKDLTWTILSAESKPSGDVSLLGQLWQGAQSVVQVRRTDDLAGKGTESILARTEAKLQADDLDGALREVAQLEGDARKAAQPFMAKLASRLAVDQAMAQVESSLAKMMGPASSPPAPAPASTN